MDIQGHGENEQLDMQIIARQINPCSICELGAADSDRCVQSLVYASWLLTPTVSRMCACDQLMGPVIHAINYTEMLKSMSAHTSR